MVRRGGVGNSQYVYIYSSFYQSLHKLTPLHIPLPLSYTSPTPSLLPSHPGASLPPIPPTLLSHHYLQNSFCKLETKQSWPVLQFRQAARAGIEKFGKGQLFPQRNNVRKYLSFSNLPPLLIPPLSCKPLPSPPPSQILLHPFLIPLNLLLPFCLLVRAMNLQNPGGQKNDKKIILQKHIILAVKQFVD